MCEDTAMRIASAGHAVFSATMIAIGMLGLIKGDFAPVWEPVPKNVPAREALVYFCALVSLASGIGLCLLRAAALASRVLLASLVLWFLLFRLPVIVAAPAVEVSWQGCGETAVVVAGAWVLYAWFAADGKRLHFAAGEGGVRSARI